MKEIYLATDAADARLVQALLLREGIETEVREPAASPPTVWVKDDEDEQPARSLLAALLEDRPDKPPPTET